MECGEAKTGTSGEVPSTGLYELVTVRNLGIYSTGEIDRMERPRDRVERDRGLIVMCNM
jgi:hypothetical protein